MVWSVCCSQVALVCSRTVSVSPGGSKGTCTQVWGGSKPLGSVSQVCMYGGDWTASHVGAPPFWVKWRMSHVSAPPWRTEVAWLPPSWMTWQAWEPPSWATHYAWALPSWNWTRWWAKGSFQIMSYMLLLYGHCISQVLCVTGSDQNGSGSKGPRVN